MSLWQAQHQMKNKFPHKKVMMSYDGYKFDVHTLS